MKIRIMSLLMIFLLIRIFTVNAFAAEQNFYAEGLQAEALGNINLAIEKYEESAATGLSDAKFALGRLYRDSYADDKNSFQWFLESAKQGNNFAQYEVGMLYLIGNSFVIQSTDEAAKWLTQAANRGKIGDAAYELFKLSTTDSEKQSWLLKSSEYGVPEAMKKLSDAYKTGNYGFTADDEKAAKWKQEASRLQGDS